MSGSTGRVRDAATVMDFDTRAINIFLHLDSLLASIGAGRDKYRRQASFA